MLKLFKMHILGMMFLAFSNTLVLAGDKCFYEYKAKQDDPLRLHVGILQTNHKCGANQAMAELRQRLDAGGWKLIQVVTSFEERPSNEQLQKYGHFIFKY